jgi:Ser/Thr protein kinase RdoA (MazF antagonist)
VVRGGSGRDLFRAREIVPGAEREIVQRVNELLVLLESMPTTARDFGLVHDDLNMTNFFVESNQLTIFDFDDCCYDWFASDLATTVPYFSSQFTGEEGERQARHFFHHFSAGYRQENELLPFWLERLPDFFRLHNLSGVLFSYTIDRDNREEYKGYFDLVWKVYREGCTLFRFDFLQSYREALAG